MDYSVCRSKGGGRPGHDSLISERVLAPFVQLWSLWWWGTFWSLFDRDDEDHSDHFFWSKNSPSHFYINLNCFSILYLRKKKGPNLRACINWYLQNFGDATFTVGTIPALSQFSVLGLSHCQKKLWIISKRPQTSLLCSKWCTLVVNVKLFATF